MYSSGFRHNGSGFAKPGGGTRGGASDRTATQEVQRAATEMSRDLAEMEFSKRDNQYSDLKAHVDFCTKGTADEVIQMWQYVQRIDTDVRDVVLRLGE